MVALSWQLSLISLVVLPPAIWLTRRVADPAPRDHRRPAARDGRPQRHRRGSAVDQRHPAGPHDGHRTALVERFTASSRS
jgi:ATP-binding cassette subfamily B protein